MKKTFKLFVCLLALFMMARPVQAKTIDHFHGEIDNDVKLEDNVEGSTILAGSNTEMTSQADGVSFMAGNKVEFKDVSFTYEGAMHPALSHVSFTAEPGKTVALVGPSGGGKTTAASLIPRFWDATHGVVEIGGVSVTQIDPHVLMGQVAFVFQDNHLFKASILDNVRASRPQASRDDVLGALLSAQCEDIIEKLPDGIDTLIGPGGTYLSGGEMQRIAIARAILKDAPIVVLDEATAFADPENEVLIQKAFSSLASGRTVIMIAHRLSTVTAADKIIVLDKGRVVEEGKHPELLASGGLYARMWADYGEAVRWKISGDKEAE